MRVGMTQASDGTEFEAYISEHEAVCPTCGKKMYARVNVVKDLADSMPDPAAHIQSFIHLWTRDLNPDYLAKNCKGDPEGRHGQYS